MLHTSQVKFCECCVCFQCIAQCSCSFIANPVPCLLVFVVGNVSNSSSTLSSCSHLATSFQCASSHPLIFARLSLATRGSGNARLCWPSLRPSQELSQVLDFSSKLVYLVHILLAHPTERVIGVLCLSSMSRSVLLLLLLQCYCLLVGVGCWQCLQFIHFPRFLFAHLSDPVIGVLCLFLKLRSVLLLFLLQCH